LPIGAAGAGAAWVLLRLISLITNLLFYQRISFDLVTPGAVHNPAWLILLAPTVGGLIVGLMARYGARRWWFIPVTRCAWWPICSPNGISPALQSSIRSTAERCSG
jgi:hypothetical protein